jgi:hypothetical protein
LVKHEGRFQKEKEKKDTPELPRATKPRIEPPPKIEVLDLEDWLRRTEKVCHRAGELRKYLDLDKQRMLRRMETFEEDQILTDIQPMWVEKLPCGWKEVEDEDSIPDGGKPSGRGIPSPHLIRGILEREGMMQSYNQRGRWWEAYRRCGTYLQDGNFGRRSDSD